MRRSVALLVGLAVALAGCGRSGASAAPASVEKAAGCELVSGGNGPRGKTAIRVEVVAKGLEVPWGVAFLPGGDMLVTERPGRVRLVSKSGEVSRTVATPEIAPGSEGGLLGIALHPDFAANHLFYVYLTAREKSGPENRVLRYRLSDSNDQATFDKLILSGIPASKYHDGGRLRFGPDRMLYVGTGDGREPDRSQDPKSLGGKILRVDPEGAAPPDNPIPGNPAFVFGARNVEAFDWIDPSTLVVADHGPSGEYKGRSGHDEVSVVTRGQNLGWPTVYACEAAPGLVAPSLVWADAVPPGGGAIYRGDSIPDWRGAFVVGTLKSTHLHVIHFDKDNPRRVTSHEVYLDGKEGYGRLRDVLMGPDGHLYVTTSNCDGRGDCPDDKDRILRVRGRG